MSADPLQEILKNRKITVATTATEQLTVVEQDQLFDQLRGLTNPQFKAWYCKTFKRLGRERVLKLASIAKADAKSSPQRYFSWLLANEKISSY